MNRVFVYGPARGSDQVFLLHLSFYSVVTEKFTLTSSKVVSDSNHS